jgi:hypothetical protein
MLAAARRFKEAREVLLVRASAGEVLSDREIVEMHEAAFALMWATGTTDVRQAMDALHRFGTDSSHIPGQRGKKNLKVMFEEWGMGESCR